MVGVEAPAHTPPSRCDRWEADRSEPQQTGTPRVQPERKPAHQLAAWPLVG